MGFHSGLPVFDKSGKRLGTLDRWSPTAPRTYRINEVEDFGFFVPRNDGDLSIITEPVQATFVASASSAGGQTATDITISKPAGAVEGDRLLAIVETGGAAPPTVRLGTSGFTRLQGLTGPGTRVVLLERVVGASDPSSYTFPLSVAGIVRGVIVAYRDAFAFAPFSYKLSAASAAIVSPSLDMVEGPEWYVSIAGGDRNTTFTPVSGAVTVLNQHSNTNLTLAVAHRTISAPNENGKSGSTSWTASTSGNNIGVGVMVQGTPSVKRMLMADNLIYIANSLNMRGWGGSIEQVQYDDTGAHVKCVGTLALLGSIETSQIEQDEGLAYTIARRLVQAANARKASHGDLQIGFYNLPSADDRPNRGLYRFRGDILQGVQQLARETLCESYMVSGITDGKFWTTLYWGGELSADHTATILHDGDGGQLAPGTKVNESASDNVTYARLRGAQTELGQYVDYQSVQGVIRELIPEVTKNIGGQATARQREEVNFSVSWGISKARQQQMAREVQDRYIDFYKRFLYGLHDRAGMPFLDGYDYAGIPDTEDPWLFRMAQMRTVNTLGQVGQLSSMTSENPNVPLAGIEDFRFKAFVLESYVTGGAYDHTSRRLRWLAKADTGIIGRYLDGVATGDILRVANPSTETLQGVATDAAEPSSVWVLVVAAAGSTVKRYDASSGTLLSSWSVPEFDLTDIAVDQPRGLLYTVGPTGPETPAASGSFASVVSVRDLNSGRVLRTFVSASSFPPVGIQLTGAGDFAYVAHSSTPPNIPYGTEIRIYRAEDGRRAGSKFMPITGVTGMFIDQPDLEIWLMQALSIRAYHATLATASVPPTIEVQGAPGFDRVSGGQFVHIVMAKNRQQVGDDAPPSPPPSPPPPGGGGYYTAPNNNRRSILGNNTAYGYPDTGQRRRPLQLHIADSNLTVPPIIAVVHIGGFAYGALPAGIDSAGHDTYDHVSEAIGGSWNGATYHSYISKNGQFTNILNRDLYAAHGNPVLKQPNRNLGGITKITTWIVNGVANGTLSRGTWTLKRKPDEFVFRQIVCTNVVGSMSRRQRETMAYLLAKDAVYLKLPITRGVTVLTHADLDSVNAASCAWPPATRESEFASLVTRANQIKALLIAEQMGIPPDNLPPPPLPVHTSWRRPLFRSQFGYQEEPDYKRQFEPVNCGFATAAMGLDRHTDGAQQPRPNDLRWETTNKSEKILSAERISLSGASMAQQKTSWANWNTGYFLKLVYKEHFTTFIDQIKSGRAAMIEGRFSEIPRRYNCQCTYINSRNHWKCYEGRHSLYVNEIRANGDLLCFDPICRKRDSLAESYWIDRDSLDPAYAYETSEQQPKWIPQDIIRDYGAAFLGYDSGGHLLHPGRLNVAYTKVTGKTTSSGGSLPDGAVFVVYAPGKYETEISAAATPSEPAVIARTWVTKEQIARFANAADIILSDPEQVIQGEEGQVDVWQPTAMGYGKKGIFYQTTASGTSIKSHRWYLHPWDIPVERFWLDPPEWPEGEAFLDEAIAKHNRAQGVQALEVINRASLWEQVDLGSTFTLQLGLQGSHPSGYSGKVRVVAFIPDEDSGYMQLLTEMIP